jgi:pimeloyl-ACP methyl ester carboxylesterase
MQPRPSTAEELQVEIPGFRLAARAWGDPEGAPVLALHGWLDNAATFDRLAPLLPRSLRIVALDLPGHGRSDRRGAESFYHYIDWVGIVLDVVDALGWSRFSLLGHSMGAGISTLVAGTVPERVRRAVLIEGLGPMTQTPDRTPEQLRAHLAARAQQRERGGDRPGTTLERLAQARQQQPNAPLEPLSAQLLVERGTVERSDGRVWGHDPRLRCTSALRLSEAQVLAFIGRITCPVLVIKAEEGWPVDRAALEGRFRQLATGTLIERPGHHHLHLDDPQGIATEIAEFLGTC